MQLAKLKNLSRNQCREALLSGRVTEFEYMLHEYLTGEISWPVYRGKDVATLREKLNLTQKGLALLMGFLENGSRLGKRRSRRSTSEHSLHNALSYF